MLTDIAIRKLPPGDYGDRDGLSLRIGKTGSRMFRFTYRAPADGKIKRVAIGNYLPARQRADHNAETGVTLAEARKEALRLRELVKAGIDPAETVQAERTAAEAHLGQVMAEGKSGAPLTVRATPSTNGASVGSVADGATVHITCQKHGSQVTGTYGTTTLWDFIGNGYVSDAYVKTGSDGQVAPTCQ